MASTTALPPINNAQIKDLHLSSVNHQRTRALHVASNQKKEEMEICSYPEMTAIR